MKAQARFLAAVGFALLTMPVAAFAQAQTGRVVGRVIDQETGHGLSGAEVTVVGTRLGALSGVDGRYTITGVSAGVRSIQAVYLGHATRTVQEVRVPSGGAVQQDFLLEPAAVAVEAITVTATRAGGSVTAALNEQRVAVGVIDATTAEQISHSPDADAAQAVQRVSGVTVRDGRYVIVRGLGERYTTTSLNGARVPSPEPEKKDVPLDLFPSSLLDAITTEKTFTPDHPGDFSGAEVNLRTRTFPARRMVQISFNGGLNTQVTGRDILAPVSVGQEWLASAASRRELPGALTAVKDFTHLTQSDINTLIRQIPTDWTSSRGSGGPNGSGSVSIGGEDPILGRRIGYIGSLSYQNSNELHNGEIRARAVPGDTLGTPRPYNTFTGTTGVNSVLWGGLLNLTTYFGKSTKLEFNNTYDRSADNLAHLDWGTLEEFQQVDSVRRTSMQYVERSVRSDQLRAEHQINDSNKLSWALTSSGVSRTEPDRSDLAYGYEFAPTGERLPLAWLGFIPEAAKRTSSALSERALNGQLDYALQFGSPEHLSTFKLGGAYRHTHRDADQLSYNLRAIGLAAQERTGTPDQIFDGAYTEGDAAHITLEPNNSGGAYSATDNVAAGYGMVELPLGSRIRLIGGARVEQWKLDMTAAPTSGEPVQITRKNTDVLPSLALNAKLSENQTLRLSVSQTLSRPEYRELAPINYRDMLGEREVFGDSSLVRTLVQNYDARWEWYPNVNEVVSVAFFAKRFDNPIEQIDVATSGVSQLSFINAKSAFNYGTEIELRKGLGILATALDPVTVFSNVTLMRSRINTSNSHLSALTNDNRPMVGQAPYVVNAGLSYATNSGATSATLLYNVVGRRIVYAAVKPLNVDTYEQPRSLLDFSLRFPLRGNFSAKFDAKNLLDSPFAERQGPVQRYRYTTGRVFNLGMTFKLQ
jgi:hypothetical protein